MIEIGAAVIVSVPFNGLRLGHVVNVGTGPEAVISIVCDGKQKLRLRRLDAEGRTWCRGDDLNSEAAQALQVAAALS